jgi:hypothetical protein
MPTIPMGLDPRLDEYLHQLNEFVQELTRFMASWEGMDIDLAKIGFVDRGDPSSGDWAVGDLTMDGTWNDLDCSSVVPENAVAIIFRVNVVDATVNKALALRKNGNSNAIAIQAVRTQIADQANDACMIIACDANRVVEYKGDSGLSDVAGISITGWFLND